VDERKEEVLEDQEVCTSRKYEMKGKKERTGRKEVKRSG
jgi:hypothetical protein